MTFRLTILSVVLASVFATRIADASDGETVEQVLKRGVEAYHTGDYPSAVLQFERVLALPLRHPDVYYNLGNAYYRLNEFGQAVYNYEQALLLDPHADDVRYNLSVVREVLDKKAQDILKGLHQPWWVAVRDLFSLSGWFYFFVVLWWISLAAFVLFRILPSGARRAIALIVASVGFTASFLLGTVLWLKYQDDGRSHSAIVLADKADVNEGPGSDTRRAFAVHAGLKVKIIDESGDEWLRVRLANGLEGWMPRQSLGIL